MIVTTTKKIEKKSIRKYLGIVSGEAVLGSNAFKELIGGVKDLIGGRNQEIENKLNTVREYAIEDMTIKGKILHADAIIGVDLDFHTLGGMMLCVATGTAVWLDNIEHTNKETTASSKTQTRRSLHDY